MDRRDFLIRAGCLLASTAAGTAGAQNAPIAGGGTGGGDLNPSLQTDPRAIERWQDAKFGLTVHWGPIALRGAEIGWSRGVEVPVKDYDSLYKDFDPVLFNAAEWGHLIRNSGFRYVTFVSKHHDGFAMWNSKQTEFNIMNSAFHRDWLKEISSEIRRQGIIFGTYYSILDFYQYDYGSGTRLGSTPNRGGPGFKLDRPTDFERYVRYMKAQLKELVEDYGVEIMLFDGNWDPIWTHERGSDLYRYLRGLKESLIINNRVDAKDSKEDVLLPSPGFWVLNSKPWNYHKYAGDYFEREEYIGGSAPYPWESWITLGDQWAWKPNDKYKPAEDCIRYLIAAAGGGGNFNLNVTPMPDGRFEQRQKDILGKIGAWLNVSGESIYGTRRGPFDAGLWGASTQRGNTIYLHILAWPDEKLKLSPLDRPIRSARLLNGNQTGYKQTSNQVAISVPEGQRDSLDTIVILQTDS